MMNIKQGEKASFNGVLLTVKEFERYSKLLKTVTVFKSYKKDYDLTYKSGYK